MTSKINNKGFEKLDKELLRTAKNYHLESALYKYKAQKYWNQVAGNFLEEIENLTKVLDFKKGVLKVACLSKQIASQIKLLSDKIIYALNKAFGKTVVYALYLEV